jgi:hypothetical protein
MNRLDKIRAQHAEHDMTDSDEAYLLGLINESGTFTAEAWDRLLPPQPGSMRARMLADEELSEEEFERQAHRIALESHEDRLKLWETALERWKRLQRLEGSQSDGGTEHGG